MYLYREYSLIYIVFSDLQTLSIRQTTIYKLLKGPVPKFLNSTKDFGKWMELSIQAFKLEPLLYRVSLLAETVIWSKDFDKNENLLR